MANDITIVVTAKDMATKAIKGMGDALDNLKSAVFSVQGALGGLTIGAIAGGLLDINRRELVDEEGVGLSLSTAEFDLLRVFLERPQRVLSRDQLLDLARGREAVAFDRAIDTLVSRLRRKLERDPKNPELIKTIWGGGYLFAADVTQE